MATVTRKFRDNFDRWSSMVQAAGEWTAEQIECSACKAKPQVGSCCLRAMLRQDFTPGPDKLRNTPHQIDDHEERYRLWDGFFATES